ncbi:MAG: replication-associated recombination protein A [SAR202 cluster bacterium]|nr:replication-associated recombination protein A [SAR202 cluster bacterium]|tara:strand:+ start:87595 stop:88863 length:1269 start_codon:yes stop_codon:yes gene_type:complete
MTLFDNNRKNQLDEIAPLAARVRPKNFQEFIGHENVVGESSALRQTIKKGKIPSIILWGPPGTGKTTLANIIACEIDASFYKLNAIGSGVTEIREIISKAKTNLGMNNKRSIIFIDEIHRFNKSQQQEILSHIEDGTIILIGATTENPSFEIVSQLLSRLTVIVLKNLTPKDIKSIILASIQNKNGLGKQKITISDEGLKFLIQISSGDARVALNTLEITVNSFTQEQKNFPQTINQEMIQKCVQNTTIKYDKNGDQHYQIISAYIKSLRASDINASLYWLARMIYSGEDPIFIARRMVIFASEDIGLADSKALLIALGTMQSLELIGMPEGKYTLSHATIYLAKAPKNNSAKTSINSALEEVTFSNNQPVPLHLRNAVTNLDKSMGYGENYIYPHDQKNFTNKISNFPPNIKNKNFFSEKR